MLLQYVSSSDIESKKELLQWFYPKLNSSQRIVVHNRNSKLVKMSIKNPLLMKLVLDLDMQVI